MTPAAAATLWKYSKPQSAEPALALEEGEAPRPRRRTEAEAEVTGFRLVVSGTLPRPSPRGPARGAWARASVSRRATLMSVTRGMSKSMAMRRMM